MASPKPNVLRRIAEHELATCFPDLAPTSREELATSLVRQWITNDGRAVIVTRDLHYRFHLTRREDGMSRVVRDIREGTFSEHLRRSRVIEEEIPGLLYQLSVCQSARCSTDYGEVLQLRVDPAKNLFYIELVPDRDK
jgi:hypothetical protein